VGDIGRGGRESTLDGKVRILGAGQKIVQGEKGKGRREERVQLPTTEGG